MQYATVQDMIDRFGTPELIQLTDPDDQAAVQAARVQLKLDDAQALADGYLGRVFALPLVGCAKPVGVDQVELVPPPQLTRIVCDVARYYLYDDLAPESEVYRRFKNASAELAAIAEGKAVLGCPWGGAPGSPATAGPAAGDTQHAFAPRGIGADVDGGYR
ncbi:gp436 family protein [Ottowia pentelensis]|uniref:Gp436 family protein n=1 Tax=Ottowia pentelensis TaxID=511108 RepID=A0ABV6PTH9_9BURK